MTEEQKEEIEWVISVLKEQAKINEQIIASMRNLNDRMQEINEKVEEQGNEIDDIKTFLNI